MPGSPDPTTRVERAVHHLELVAIGTETANCLGALLPPIIGCSHNDCDSLVDEALSTIGVLTDDMKDLITQLRDSPRRRLTDTDRDALAATLLAIAMANLQTTSHSTRLREAGHTPHAQLIASALDADTQQRARQTLGEVIEAA